MNNSSYGGGGGGSSDIQVFLPLLQAAALCFINTVVQTSHGSNAKVFHQHEYIEAGFSVDDIEKVRKQQL